MYFDSHVHMDVRSYEDYERMRISGIERLLTLAHNPYKMSTSDVVLDHFDRILNTETRRAEENMIELYIGLGIHPCGIPKDYERVLNLLPKLLERENVVAIGEIGLNDNTELEREVFEKQLRVAKDLDFPVIVHTPGKRKLEICLKELEIIDKVGIDDKRVVIDHATYDVVRSIRDRDFYIGLTIQPGYKLNYEDALKIINDFKLYNRFLINSDAGSVRSDIYALSRFASILKHKKYSREIIEKITYKNACTFLRI